MTYLSAADIASLSGHGPTIVSQAPLLRRQGNGNFTGFVRSTWTDGSTTEREFIVNAATREAVRAAYLATA